MDTPVAMKSEGYNLGGKISKLHGEGYTAPGQAYAIAKNMGYNQGGPIVDLEDPEVISNSPIFMKLIQQSQQYGYDPVEIPNMIFEHPQFGKLFDTPEKQDALIQANALAQSDDGGYNQGGTVGKDQLNALIAQYHSMRPGFAKTRLGNKIRALTRQVISPLDRSRSLGSGGGFIPRRGYNTGGSVEDQYAAGTFIPGVNQPKPTVNAPTNPNTLLGGTAPELETGSIITPETKEVAGGSDMAANGANQALPGVLPNKTYDYILERSRQLHAGKGSGAAKLGAKDYVDELYKPPGGYAKAGSGSGGVSKRAFNLEYRDENGELQVRAGRQGPNGYELKDDNGNWVDAAQVAGTQDIRIAPRSANPGIEAGAGGIPNAVSYNEATGIPTFTFNRESEGKAYGYTVRAIAADKNLSGLESKIPPQEISSLYGGLAQWAARNANAGITPAVINSVLEKSGLQQYSREMTKFLQAILRNDTGAAYTGTEIADYLAAFGIAPGTQITPEILQSFQNGRKQEIATSIGRTGQAGPYLTGLLEGKYPTPGIGNDVGVVNKEGNSGTTSSGVNWKIVK